MKEIVVISGKGGTGKTSITASLANLGGKNVMVADCDVDAADMHLLMQPDFDKAEDFFSGVYAEIDSSLCTQCGLCVEKCRFDAINKNGKDEFVVTKLDCEGCGYCAKICPVNAITMHDQNVGKWFTSKVNTGSTMVHAKLGIGAENSGKLVAKVKNEAKKLAVEQNKKYTLIDGSPGVGCPVVSSLSGADYVVLVTEPSVSGVHDLKRVYELVQKFKIKAGCIINKHDINKEKTEEIIQFLKKEKIEHIACLPYDENFTKAMTMGKTIVEYDSKNLGKTLSEAWGKIQTFAKQEKN